MSDGDGTKRVLVVGTEPAVVSATVSILAELGRTAVPIDPRPTRRDACGPRW